MLKHFQITKFQISRNFENCETLFINCNYEDTNDGDQIVSGEIMREICEAYEKLFDPIADQLKSW